MGACPGCLSPVVGRVIGSPAPAKPGTMVSRSPTRFPFGAAATPWNPVGAAGMPDPARKYAADVIEVLASPEAIRRRPAMYLGPVDDPLAATRLLRESLCLALDAACCGACTRIDVTLHRD